MEFIRETIALESRLPVEVLDLTSQLLSFCRKLSSKRGLIVISSAHTTACIRINEKCAALEKDLTRFLSGLADPKAPYVHNEQPVDGRPNAHSHLLSYLLASSETVVLEDGTPLLGQWQNVFFVELDGPRKNRQAHFTFIGE
jgi:secondary thiamine-phosphate synthase enzyme